MKLLEDTPDTIWDCRGLIALTVLMFLFGLVLIAITEPTTERKSNASIKAGIDKTECAEILKPVRE